MNVLFKIQLIGCLCSFGNAETLLRQTFAIKGEDISLGCPQFEYTRIVEYNEDVVVWKLNGTAIFLYPSNHLSNMPDYVTIHDDEPFVLTIANFSSIFGGVYTCCTIPASSNCISYTVQVKEPPVVKSIEGYTLLKAGDNLNLTCTATGFPTPNITWNRQKTSKSQQIGFHHERNIFFENVDDRVSGVYTCIASQENIEDSKSVTVMVFRDTSSDETMYNGASYFNISILYLILWIIAAIRTTYL